MAPKKKQTAPRRSYERAAQRGPDWPVVITPVEYGGVQAAYDHFNEELFEGKLPDVFITYQRKAHSAGYFSPDRFSGRIGEFGKHELALNPDADKQICQGPAQQGQVDVPSLWGGTRGPSQIISSRAPPVMPGWCKKLNRTIRRLNEKPRNSVPAAAG